MRPSSNSPMVLEGFNDANWAFDPNDQRSNSGFRIYLGPNLMSWQSKSNIQFLDPALKLNIGALPF